MLKLNKLRVRGVIHNYIFCSRLIRSVVTIPYKFSIKLVRQQCEATRNIEYVIFHIGLALQSKVDVVENRLHTKE